MNSYNPYMNPYTPRTNNGIIWVQGIEGAKAYQLMPNSNAVLLDSEIDNRFYIKVSDNVGMCTLRTFNFEEITEMPKSNSEYVTKSELETAIANIKEIINGKQSISAVKSEQSE